MWNVVHVLKPALLMVMVQVANAWVNVLYKLAVNDGMSLRVVVAYRYIFATAFIAPLAYILERFIFLINNHPFHLDSQYLLFEYLSSSMHSSFFFGLRHLLLIIILFDDINLYMIKEMNI